MKYIMHEREDIDKFVADKEYIANTYVMRCFLISMIVYFIGFLLNILNLFIVDKKIRLFRGDGGLKIPSTPVFIRLSDI